MALLDDVKAVVMVHGTDDVGIVAELQGLIEAAKSELRTAGVAVGSDESDYDALLYLAIVFYCKANFGMDNPDARLYDERFERLKQILSIDDVTSARAVT